MEPSPSGRSVQAEPALRRGREPLSGEEPVAEGPDEGLISQKMDPFTPGKRSEKGFIAEQSHQR
jgi:hypothetical protein